MVFKYPLASKVLNSFKKLSIILKISRCGLCNIMKSIYISSEVITNLIPLIFTSIIPGPEMFVNFEKFIVIFFEKIALVGLV